MDFNMGTIDYLRAMFDAEGPIDPSIDPDDLVRMYQKGQASFTAVLRQYTGLLLSKSDTWVPSYTQEELFQELSIKTYWAAQRWDGDKGVKFITYLTKCLNQHIVKLLRESNFDKRRANQEISESYDNIVDEELFTGFEYAQTDESINSKTESGYDKIDMICGVELNQQESICVDLVFEGYLNVDIARHLGLTKSRITTIFRGLAPRFKFLLDARG